MKMSSISYTQIWTLHIIFFHYRSNHALLLSMFKVKLRYFLRMACSTTCATPGSCISNEWKSIVAPAGKMFPALCPQGNFIVSVECKLCVTTWWPHGVLNKRHRAHRQKESLPQRQRGRSMPWVLLQMSNAPSELRLHTSGRKGCSNDSRLYFTFRTAHTFLMVWKPDI